MAVQTTTAKSLLTEFTKAISHAPMDEKKCSDTLLKLKLELLNFQLIPPFTDTPAETNKQLQIARETVEQAALFAIQKKDMVLFQRYYAQAKIYYYDFQSILKPSVNQWMLIGLNLLALLAENKIEEFHTELELIALSERDEKPIRFPMEMEEYLMEGSYKKVLSARSAMPFDSFGFFLDILIGTVRERILECVETAYQNIEVGNMDALLMLENKQQLQQISEKRGWAIVDDKVVFPVEEDNSKHLNAKELVEQNLHYATELERIV